MRDNILRIIVGIFMCLGGAYSILTPEATSLSKFGGWSVIFLAAIFMFRLHSLLLYKDVHVVTEYLTQGMEFIYKDTHTRFVVTYVKFENKLHVFKIKGSVNPLLQVLGEGIVRLSAEEVEKWIFLSKKRDGLFPAKKYELLGWYSANIGHFERDREPACFGVGMYRFDMQAIRALKKKATERGYTYTIWCDTRTVLIFKVN